MTVKSPLHPQEQPGWLTLCKPLHLPCAGSTSQNVSPQVGVVTVDLGVRDAGQYMGWGMGVRKTRRNRRPQSHHTLRTSVSHKKVAVNRCNYGRQDMENVQCRYCPLTKKHQTFEESQHYDRETTMCNTQNLHQGNCSQS